MKVEVDYDEYWDRTDDVEDSDEPYSYQGRSYYTAEIVSVTRCDNGEFEVEGDHDKVYVIYSRYSTGDSFQNSEGHMGIVGVVATIEEAEEFCKMAWKFVSTGAMFSFEYKGKSYYVPGAGDFFGGVDDIEYEEWEVR